MTLPQWLRFCLVGALGVLVNTGVLVLLKEYAGFPLLVGSLLAIECAIISNFCLNDIWTFKDNGEKCLIMKFVIFQAVSIGGLVINVFFLMALTSLFGVWYIAANLCGIAVATGWNYLMNKKVTWG